MATAHHLAERFAQTLTDHDLAALAELLHPDYVNHNRYAQPGTEGSVAIFADFLSAFADFRVEVDDVIEAGQTVVGRYTYRGRQTGTFMGIPPTGAQIRLRVASAAVKHRAARQGPGGRVRRGRRSRAEESRLRAVSPLAPEPFAVQKLGPRLLERGQRSSEACSFRRLEALLRHVATTLSRASSPDR